MTRAERAAYDANHSIADDDLCEVNGCPAAECPRGCSHDADLESLRAEAEELGCTVGEVRMMRDAENAGQWDRDERGAA